MKIEDVKKIAVVGAGIMGSQIAENLSRFGKFKVCMLDKDDQLVNKGLQSIGFRLDRYFVSKGKITEQEKQETLARIAVGTEIEKSVIDADVVIEAIVENLQLKKEIFRKAFDHMRPRVPSLPPTPLCRIFRRWLSPQKGRIKWWASTFSIPSP